MKLPGPEIRTALLGVAILAVLVEIGGLRQRARRFATKAREAAVAEQVDERVARNSTGHATQCLEEAERIAATDPARASELRAKANRALRDTPFFKCQAKRAAIARAAFEHAMTHRREGQSPDEPWLDTAPPEGS
jgi:hypothetical protein